MLKENLKRYTLPTAIGTALTAASGSALAQVSDLETAATASLGGLSDTAVSIGAVIIGIVAIGVAVALIIGMMRKS